jgi:hypothetical protein
MSVENVPAVVNIKTLKGRCITHKFSTGWVWKRRRMLLTSLQSSIGQKSRAGLTKFKKENYGVHKYWVLLAVIKE